MKILSHDLPLTLHDVRAGDILRYQINVKIIGRDPHLALAVMSHESGRKTGNIGHQVFYDAEVEALPVRQNTHFEDDKQRAPSHLKRGARKIRLDSEKVRITQ